MTIGTAHHSDNLSNVTCTAPLTLSDSSNSSTQLRRIAPVASRGGREEYTNRSFSRPREDVRRGGPPPGPDR